MNSFGHFFRVTSFGESHGPAIGCVVDGVPPRVPLSVSDLQLYLDRRRPGQTRFTSQRREPDRVQILSGWFEGQTTGTPLGLQILNEDQRSGDYSAIAELYRPGHADYTYDKKYGIRDPRGGGRASARETAVRVAAGGVARKILTDAITIQGYLIELGAVPICRDRFDASAILQNPFFSPDPASVSPWEEKLDASRRAGDSLGGILEVRVEGVPAGWGAPVYGRLDAELAAALMSINAVKGVEIGDGFEAARLTGWENADQMRMQDGRETFLSNHAGGILGGISTGQPLLVRAAVKPTSSIRRPTQTVTRGGQETECITTGRHDPCVAIRAVPVAEAMVACVLADQKLRHRAQCG